MVTRDPAFVKGESIEEPSDDNDIASHDDDDDDNDNDIIEQEEEKSRANEVIGLTSQETSDEGSSKSNVESLVTEIGNAKIDDGSNAVFYLT